MGIEQKSQNFTPEEIQNMEDEAEKTMRPKQKELSGHMKKRLDEWSKDGIKELYRKVSDDNYFVENEEETARYATGQKWGEYKKGYELKGIINCHEVKILCIPEKNSRDSFSAVIDGQEIRDPDICRRIFIKYWGLAEDYKELEHDKKSAMKEVTKPIQRWEDGYIPTEEEQLEEEKTKQIDKQIEELLK
jgi:hypothetical protein